MKISGNDPSTPIALEYPTQRQQPPPGLKSPLYCAICVILGMLLFGIFHPGLRTPRDLPPRSICSANLRGIGQSMHIYSNDYEDWFPVDLHKEVPETAADETESISAEPPAMH